MAKGMVIKCLICGSEKYIYPSRIKDGKGKYCSKNCKYISEKGKKLSIEHKKKIALSIVGKNMGSKNTQWKGDKVEYNGIHNWLKTEYGKANKCENLIREFLEFPCSDKSRTYQWALLKNKRYERNRNNFINLCTSCHKKYDKCGRGHKKIIRAKDEARSSLLRSGN